MFEEHIETINKHIYDSVMLLEYFMTQTLETVLGGPREVYFPHLVPIVATNAITE